MHYLNRGLQMPKKEVAFTACPKNFRYGRSMFCLLHIPNLSDIFDLCLHWMSVVQDLTYIVGDLIYAWKVGLSGETWIFFQV